MQHDPLPRSSRGTTRKKSNFDSGSVEDITVWTDRSIRPVDADRGMTIDLSSLLWIKRLILQGARAQNGPLA